MNSTTRIWTQDPLITRQALYHRATIATLSKMKPYNWVISSDGDPKIDLGSRKRKQLKKCYPPLTSQKWVSLSFQALIPGSFYASQFFDAFPVTMIPGGSAIEPSYGAVHGKCKYWDN